MSASFKYVGEWDNFKSTYHRRLAKVMIDLASSTFRFEQVDDKLNFFTRAFLAPITLTLDPPEKLSLDFANALEFIEEDLDKYFEGRRLAKELARKKEAALAKLTDEDKRILGIHEFKDVNIKENPLKTEEDIQSETKEVVQEPEVFQDMDAVYSKTPKETPKGAYLINRADGVDGHYAVGRWNILQYQEVWHPEKGIWASASDSVLSLEEATKLMNQLNYEYNAGYLIGLPKKD